MKVPSVTYIVSILFVLGLMVIAVQYFGVCLWKSGGGRGKEGMENQKGEITLMLFYADWCPYCTKMKPEWDKLVADTTAPVNGYAVKFVKIDCTDKTDPAVTAKMNEFHVDGWPSIKLVHGKQIVSFDADPTEANLHEFIVQTTTSL